MINERYHNNINVSRLGTESPRSYYIPYATPDEAKADIREESSRFKLLSGTKWSFSYFDSYEDIPASITDKDTDISKWDRLPVPSNWQLHGYDHPAYLNTRLPFPVDIPFVPKNTPASVYAIDFTINSDLDAFKKYVVFEGVDSCLYLYINGHFVGYSQISHMLSEFDITTYLCNGKNRLTAVVCKWCDGTYLECQDKWRMSGIFRDVYLLVRPKGHIGDVFVKTKVAEDYSEAKIKLDIDSPISEDSIVTVFDPSGEKCEAVVFDANGHAEITVNEPKMWSAEYPELYTCIIESANEFITIPVGIRTLEIENGVFKFNGRAIKLKGVNRHDFNFKNGYTCSLENMKKDIILMKRHNINAIRTSHYPNDPRFLELCDKMGIYVLSEADFETHEVGYPTLNNLKSDLKYSIRNIITNDPMWENQICERIKLMVENFKNHPSVFAWSMGNESGYGCNIEKAVNETKKRDDTRFVHYESHVTSGTEINLHNNNWPDSLDFISHMYPTVDWCQLFVKTAEETNYSKPLVLCEYSHAMGNGPGDLKDYWDVINSSDRFTGGFVWEWFNHGIYSGKAENGKPKYFFGGDFGERFHDGNFCCDGLVMPDMVPTPGLKELKNIIKPFHLTPVDLATGTFDITNDYDFSYMSRLDGSWELTQNGKVVASGIIGSLAIPPHKTEKLHLSYNMPSDGKCYVRISFSSCGNSYIPDGEIIGFEQYELPTEQIRNERITVSEGNVNFTEDNNFVTVTGRNFAYTYSKRNCAFSSLKVAGKELLKSGFTYTVWRAPIDNDSKNLWNWNRMELHAVCASEHSTDVAFHDDFVSITSDFALAAESRFPLYKIVSEWSVFSDGKISMHLDAKIGEGLSFKPIEPEKIVDLFHDTMQVVDYLPRFAIMAEFDKQFDNIDYFGMGPGDNYADRHNASFMGRFSNKVGREFVNYIKPQECGNHTCTEWAYLHNSDGFGIAVEAEHKPFEFSALPYSPKEITRATHSYELPESDKTVLIVNYKQSGVGSESCGPKMLEKYRFNDEEFSFSITLTPTLSPLDYPSEDM